jgi:hypothetical protein
VRDVEGAVPACFQTRSADSLTTAWQKHWQQQLSFVFCGDIPSAPHFVGVNVQRTVVFRRLALLLGDKLPWALLLSFSQQGKRRAREGNNVSFPC